ncbi:tetratricopeptide repeat protein [Enterococcus malodoratus]|uniref:tetratricopeptide repeat protein n=1 Tax=Enterococcus malodoratus TaxID=71451 RepID=UPI0039B004F6
MGLFDVFKKDTPQPTKSDSPIRNIDLFVENNLKGIELEKNGKIDEAIKLYENNVKNSFDGNHPYDRLAIIYRKRKDYNNEIRVLQSAIDTFEKISPDRRDVAPKLLKFKKRLAKAKELNDN